MTPKIVIENEVSRKVMHWVNKSNDEVSGLGTVRVEPNGVLRVISAMLLPQTNGAVHTDIEAEEVNKAIYELRNSTGDLRWWWHSHVNMNVFWSGTDMDTIKKIGAGGWFAATVFNKKRETKSAYYGIAGQVTPWGASPLFLDDLETSVAEENDLISAWDAEYDKNVTQVQAAKRKSWIGDDMGYPYNNLNFPMGGRNEYRKNEHGVYEKVPTQIIPITQLPMATRPPHVSKRDWKRMKKALKEAEIEASDIVPLSSDDLPEHPDPVIDEYGLTPDEQQLFAYAGWAIGDIENLLEEDFSVSEMLQLANAGQTPIDIEDLLADQYSPTDIMGMLRDVPVADRRHVSEAQ